ncbi:molybdopterin-guanine dinucleotide biosynthesis protein MobA [Planococcus sp. PAMC 21323]|uniref:molybdenum cofactor guanylyltransferase n=1 Tax=Planococcus sp. PAMC 21323 TaxID=1526927 RepID=UPI000571B30E|nr:molybdenum cofactor guanylyltransferase [Planococcus sp. PAMC 21323]AIY05520.1 molybdopterin-guanine dinucleotide biosynthesis protein MobA [Planococcus sp. PAMC 21323]
MTSTVGILLAGGLSRRFGSPKAFAVMEETFFYERAYRALIEVCDRVVIVSRAELIPCFPAKYKVITDLDWISGQGPLAGILSGMTTIPAEKYVVLPCDMPFIGSKEIGKLVTLASTTADITAVINDTEKIPLLSVWDSRIKEQLQTELENGQLRVMKFMDKVTTQWIETSTIHENPLVFRNLNYPQV